jgi:transcriptional activator SPT7
VPLLDEKDDLSQLWWGAVQSDSLLNNGLPGIPFGPSSSSSSQPSSVKHKRRKPPTQQQQQQRQPANPKSLLSMMNHNIKTMRRVRHTHAKFAALTASSAPPEDEEQGAEGGGGVYGSGGAGGTATRAGLPSGIGGSGFVGSGFGLGDDDGLDDKVDEEPWTVGRGKKGKVKDIGGVEIGEANATDCLHWAGNKILEHVGFQGILFVGFSFKTQPFLQLHRKWLLACWLMSHLNICSMWGGRSDFFPTNLGKQ